MEDTICIRIPNWVGDVVMSTPALRSIRRSYPSTRIVGIVGHSVRKVLNGTGWVDDLIVYERDKGSGVAAAREFMRCASCIRELDADTAFVLPNSFSSALMMKAGLVSHVIGYKRDARGFLLTVALPRPCHPDGSFRPTYMADYYLRLCEHVGIEVDSPRTELPYTAEDASSVTSILKEVDVDPDERIILFHMTAGYGPSKLWSKNKFARLATMLGDACDARICGIGDPSAQKYIREVNSLCDKHVTDLSDCGIDLHLLKALVGMSELVVTTDSGPRHYGVALGTPTVCLMGPTHPDYSTSGRANDHVVRVDVECGPCQKKTCSRDHACMDKLTPEMVFSACERALRETANDRNQ